jgi:hypothetical protein
MFKNSGSGLSRVNWGKGVSSVYLKVSLTNNDIFHVRVHFFKYRTSVAIFSR